MISLLSLVCGRRENSTRGITKCTLTYIVSNQIFQLNINLFKYRRIVEFAGFLLFSAFRVSLRAGVFAPDVQHEDGRDEQQRHDQNWDWATEKEKISINFFQKQSKPQWRKQKLTSFRQISTKNL